MSLRTAAVTFTIVVSVISPRRVRPAYSRMGRKSPNENDSHELSVEQGSSALRELGRAQPERGSVKERREACHL